MLKRGITAAVIYDFDGTLAPGNLQENSFIPNVGMTSDAFWQAVDDLASAHEADPILTYMRLMLDKAKQANKPIRRADFERHGKSVKFFKGVPEWFDRIGDFGKAIGVKAEHYLISSGNGEIIDGTPIVGRFEKIYASRFMFDENGVAFWPALAVNFTTKTQFLFRINKGAHNISDDREVNQYVEMGKRPVPFEHMLYIGDGETDIPCFRLVKDLGGLSIAVYGPGKETARKNAAQLLKEGRVHTLAPADYREGKRLDTVVKRHLEMIASRAARNELLSRH